MHLQHRSSAARGFTLVELMVVCAVIGITAAIAYPTYTKYVQRGHRSAAQAHLIDLAQRQQQYLADSRTYAASVADLGMTTPADVSKYYTVAITVQAGPPPAFSITATPIAGSAMAGDGVLGINSNGDKTPTDKW